MYLLQKVLQKTLQVPNSPILKRTRTPEVAKTGTGSIFLASVLSSSATVPKPDLLAVINSLKVLSEEKLEISIKD